MRREARPAEAGGHAERAHLLRAALVLAAVAAALAAPVLDGRALVGADVWCCTYPLMEQLATWWRALDAPGWNVGVGIGWPVLADPSMGYAYPLHACLRWVPPTAGLGVELFLHILAGGLGARALARALALRPLPALVVGLIYGAGGTFLSNVNAPPYFGGAAWLPWAALGIVRAATMAPKSPARDDPLRRPSAGGWVALSSAAFALMFLCGAAELTVFAGPVIAALPWGTGRGRLGTGLVATAAAAALAGLLAGGLLVPSVLAFGDTTRQGGLDPALAMRWSLHPAELLGAVVPGTFGGGGLVLDWGDEATGRPWYVSTHLGVVGAAALALGLGGVRRDRLARGALVLTLVTLAWALGRWGPLYRLAAALTDAAYSVRYPAKAFAITALCLALIAGVGFQAATARAWRRIAWALTGGVAALATWATHLGGAHGGTPEGLAALGERAFGAAGAGVAAVAALTLRGRSVERRPGSRALALVLALELVVVGRAMLPWVPGERLAARGELARAVVAEQARRGEPVRLYPTRAARERSGEASPPWPVGVGGAPGRTSLLPNVLAPDGVRSLNAFAGFTSRRLVEVAEPLDAAPLPDAEVMIRYGCQLLVTTADEARKVGEAGELIAGGVSLWRLVRLRDPLPWAAVYARAQEVTDAAGAGRALADPAHDPRRVALVEGTLPRALRGGASPAPVGATGPRPARLLEDTGDRLALEVEPGPAGVLVVRDGWGPGWSARVDDAPAPVLPADGVYRAVVLPAGARRVVLEHRTPGAVAGAAASALGVLLAAGLTARALLARRGARSPS